MRNPWRLAVPKVCTFAEDRLESALKRLQRAFGPCLCIVFFLARAYGAIPLASDIQTPQIGDYTLRVLSPNVLELFRVNTKQPNPARVDSWDWVNNQQVFVAPDLSSARVLVNGQTDVITAVGFKRRPLYAPLLYWDLRIGNELYLQLSNSIPNGASVRVLNDGSLWPTNMTFAAVADSQRFSPAVHVNQAGYLPAYPKRAAVGYYLGNLGEVAIPTNRFFVVNAQGGAVAYTGTLTLRPDIGYSYTPTPYQNVYEADFTSLTTPGEYEVVVPGLGASLPFRIDEGVAMAFARTYALGMYEQRSGTNVVLPFTGFTHGVDHIAPAGVPTNDSAPFAFTWYTVSNYSRDINHDNPPQIAPILTNSSAQLFPFVNQGTVSVSGGHFEAGDYNRVTWNGAQVVHILVFAADSLPGVGALDNFGLPESGDGVSDALQEAKWEADFLAKMQDTDGAFYYSVYPQYRQYEMDVLPEDGDPQVIWPKNTATTAAAVAALAQCASSPRFKAVYPQAAANYLAKALLGWQFLTNTIARLGADGGYQMVQHFGDDFTDHDELAWAACELYLATTNAQYLSNLFAWFPDPTDPATFRWGWQRMAVCYGNAIRDYAFAVSSGRLTSGQIDQTYLARCINVITNCGNDLLGWSQDDAYGTSFPDLSKAYRSGGWYFPSEQAFDLVVAYQFNPSSLYLEAIVHNMNYEAGCNPVNVSFVTGLGWKRPRTVIDLYSLNDWRVLPKDGVPIGNIVTGFEPVWTYQWELTALTCPADSADVAPYPYYDRWSDDWNVSTEGSTTDMTRCFAATAWLAARTALAGQSWRSTNATLITPPGPTQLGQPVTVTLSVVDANLSTAQIVWEAQGQEPSFGSMSYTFVPGPQPTNYWVEAEVLWPDGRRAFATNSVTVSTNASPQLSNPYTLPGGGFGFTLSGVPQATYIVQASADLRVWLPIATNTLPAGGTVGVTDAQAPSFARRYYRAVEGQ